MHHLSEMMAGFSTKRERAGLVKTNDMVDVIDLLHSKFQIQRVGDI